MVGQRARPHAGWALAVALVLGAVGARTVSMRDSWGWDESVHAELPAARIALALENDQPDEAWAALHDCSQYPFGLPLVLAASQRAFGVSELVARRTARALGALAALGLFLLVRAAAAAAPRRRGADLAPWIALALFATSPLVTAYSGTLFLEVPFACVATFALLAWLGRGGGRFALARELWAGLLLTAAFFTKFNYGGMLLAACLADLAWEALSAVRTGRARALAARTAALAVPPVLAGLWWFAWPWPEGAETAATHRHALAGFLTGNLGLGRTFWSLRVVHWTESLVVSPRLFALVLCGALASLSAARDRGVRLLLLAALAFVLPTALHPFHLDRFLVPCAVPLFGLAGLGLGRLLPAAGRARPLALVLAAVLATAFPALDGEALARHLPAAPGSASRLLPDEEPLEEYVRGVLAAGRDARPWRDLPTGGLARAEHDALLDRVAAELGPTERLGWIGVSTELSPAALYLGLLARGYDPGAFLRHASAEPGERYVTLEAADPGWDDERLAGFAAAQDAIGFTRPIDLKDRAPRRFLEAYADRLLASGWSARELVPVAIARPLQPAIQARLFLARPPEGSR